MSRLAGSTLSDEHKQNISNSLRGRSKTFIYSKFSYTEYMELYDDFINIHLNNTTIGIEQYCIDTKKISSTTFRKFIKSNNLYCPKAQWNSTRIKLHKKYMIETRFNLDYDQWVKLQPKKKLYYNLVRSITEKQPLYLLDNFDKRGRQTFHVDHIIPIIYGYINNIAAEKIGHISNLRIISAKENLQKSCNLILD